jgi:hypothetical protein
VVARQEGLLPGDSFVSYVIDIEALRRARAQNGVMNWFKDLRTEQYAAIYEQPIYAKNQYVEELPQEGWLGREDKRRAGNIERLVERGIITPPSA